MSLTNPKCDDVTFVNLTCTMLSVFTQLFFTECTLSCLLPLLTTLWDTYISEGTLSRQNSPLPPACPCTESCHLRSYCCSVILAVLSCLKTVNLFQGNLGGCVWVCLFVCMCGWLCVYVHGCVFTDLQYSLLLVCLFVVQNISCEPLGLWVELLL